MPKSKKVKREEAAAAAAAAAGAGEDPPDDSSARAREHPVRSGHRAPAAAAAAAAAAAEVALASAAKAARRTALNVSALNEGGGNAHDAAARSHRLSRRRHGLQDIARARHVIATHCEPSCIESSGSYDVAGTDPLPATSSTRVLNPRLFCSVASCDAARDICWALTVIQRNLNPRY
jgi:hypothetical protein